MMTIHTYQLRPPLMLALRQSSSTHVVRVSLLNFDNFIGIVVFFNENIKIFIFIIDAIEFVMPVGERILSIVP
jgi:hypothetical protein